MTKDRLKNIIGHVAETNQRVGGWPPGHQVIVLRVLSERPDPHLEVESRGRKGSVHLSEINILKAKFEVFSLSKA